MNGFEFISFSVEHWGSLLFWSVFAIVFLFVVLSKLAPARLYDPLNFYVSFNLGTGYGVLISLFQSGNIESSLFFIMMFFGAVLVLSLYVFLKYPISYPVKTYDLFFRPLRSGKGEIAIILFIYIAISVLLISMSGLGALADSNRFEQARGFGVFVRILDFFRLIILGYGALVMIRNPNSRYIIAFALLIFLTFSSLLGGAKFAFLEGLYAVVVAIFSYRKQIKINFLLISVIMGIATLFAFLILSLNERNSDDSQGLYNNETNILAQKFIARILANGDSYYGSLPNNVVDNLETDNIIVRFVAPIIGISNTSKIVGYKVENYSVGRAILMYHDPWNDISGGPVSHFDLFFYVYFGIAGFIFVILMTLLISSIANKLKSISGNIFYISVMSALWIRCLPMLLEPAVGFAYVLDAFILITFVKGIYFLYLKFPTR